RRAVDPARLGAADRDRARLVGGRAGGRRATDRGRGGSGVARPRGNLPGAASMRTVARLVFTYFTASPLLTFFAAAGLVLVVVFGSPITFGNTGLMIAASLFLGALSLFVGSALMPLMFGRMAQSHVIRVLPYGRVKLLISGFLTLLIVAIPAPL